MTWGKSGTGMMLGSFTDNGLAIFQLWKGQIVH